MASTPVKTSQVDRLGLGFAGVSASTDATKLKGRASPESVRHFESLLDATNRAAPAEKPTPKATNRTPARADAQPAPRADVRDAPSESTTSQQELASAAEPSKAPEDKAPAPATEAEVSAPVEQAANIAETEADATPEAAPVATSPAASTEPTTPTETNDTAAPAETAEGAPEAPVVVATPLPALPLPVETLIAPQAAPAPQAGAVQVVPTDVDLSQQDPVTLPPTLMDDALAAAVAAASEQTKAVAPQAATPQAADPQAAPLTTPQTSPAAAPQSATPLPSTAPQSAAPTQVTAAQPAPTAADAIIEALTVITPEATAQAETVATVAQADTETAPAQQVTEKATPPTAQPLTEVQTAAAAPVVVDAQSKAKSSAPKPQTDTATQQDADTLAALPTAEAAPDADTQQDKPRQDQTPAERGRERAQERSQAGERLAARFADSQISLIRDEASLSGPMQTFKTVMVKAAAADALTGATTGQPDELKPTTSNSAAAAVINTATGIEGSSAAAKTSARPNTPVFQTPVVQQVGTRLVETAANGGGRVIMDLRPEHLGRVTIDVDVRDDGRLTATVLVDNPEALEQLRRDAGQLEQALRDTGLSPDQNSLNFALREQAQENNRFAREGRQGRGNGDGGEAEDAEPEIAAQTKQSVVPGLGVIDIRI